MATAARPPRRVPGSSAGSPKAPRWTAPEATSWTCTGTWSSGRSGSSSTLTSSLPLPFPFGSAVARCAASVRRPGSSMPATTPRSVIRFPSRAASETSPRCLPPATEIRNESWRWRGPGDPRLSSPEGWISASKCSAPDLRARSPSPWADMSCRDGSAAPLPAT